MIERARNSSFSSSGRRLNTTDGTEDLGGGVTREGVSYGFTGGSIDICELSHLVDHVIGSFRVVSSWVENQFGVVEDKKYRLGREIRSQCFQILMVLDTRADNMQ